MSSNVIYCPAIIARMLAIIATVPRLMPTTIHRILLGIDNLSGCIKYYIFSPLVDAALLYRLSYRLFLTTYAMLISYPAVIICIFYRQLPVSKLPYYVLFYNNQDVVLYRANVSVVPPSYRHVESLLEYTLINPLGSVKARS
jgi:hypothetical protein